MLVKKIRSIATAWNDFWFADAPPQSLGLLRILCGAMLFYTVFVWGLMFRDFLGNDGFNSAALMKEVQITSAPTGFLSFWWIIPEEYARTIHISSLVILALFTLGIFTRITSLLALLIAISYSHRAMLSNYGLDQINSVLVFYLAISRCGDAYSIDRILNRYRQARRQLQQGIVPSIAPPSRHWTNNLSLRLLQVHYCVIYFASGTSKLQGESWWNGEAIYRAAVNYEYQTGDLTWLAHYPWLINFLTHGTVLWEISFCFLIWNRHLRPFVLLCGVAMHLGIGAFLGMWTFGLAMIFGYLAFISPETIQRVLAPVVSLFSSRREVLQLDKVLTAPLARTARKLAFDFFNQIQIETTSVNETSDFNFNTDLAPDSDSGITSFDEFSTDPTRKTLLEEIGPVLYLCSSAPIESNTELINDLASHGYTCAVTRNINEARNLASIHNSRACILWLDASLNSLNEFSGSFYFKGTKTSIPVTLRVQIAENELALESSVLPENIRVVSSSSELSILLQTIEDLIESVVLPIPDTSDLVRVEASDTGAKEFDADPRGIPLRG